MATSMKRTSITTDDIITDVIDTVKEDVKKFKDDDMIACRSVTNGRYFFIGKKSNVPYSWADEGDIEYVEYRDLMYAVKEKNACIFKPRIIIDNADFISQNKKVKDFYDSMYTTSDFEDILNLSVNQMEKTINDLPDGAKDLLKGIVSTKINNGTLDSVKKIKVLDKIFGTEMLVMLATN